MVLGAEPVSLASGMAVPEKMALVALAAKWAVSQGRGSGGVWLC